jgi:uncharacterized membrane protein YagU involved in acid resistance
MGIPTVQAHKGETMGARLVRGAIGGFLAGLVFIGVTMWFATTQGSAALGPAKMISTIALGAGALQGGSASAPLGVVIHVVLSIVYGMVFALFVGKMRTNGTVALLGTVYGALLYVVNFLVLSPLLFPAFQMANQPFELLAHTVFGTLLAFAFYDSGVRAGEDVVVLGDAERQRVGTRR